MSEKLETKRRFPIYLPPGRDGEIAEFVENGYAKSQNDFINRAIDFYIGYLRNEKNVDYIAPILSSVIKSQIQETERNVCEMLFKLAVEVAKQNHITACQEEIDEASLAKLNDMCCRDVASNNGRVRFENAYRFQHGEDI